MLITTYNIVVVVVAIIITLAFLTITIISTASIAKDFLRHGFICPVSLPPKIHGPHKKKNNADNTHLYTSNQILSYSL